jgi:hypothetical protein
MNHNITHFSQASGCLLSSKEFQDMTNITHFNELKIPQDSELWHLQEELNKIVIEPNSDKIGIEDWTNRLKDWKESTSTLPSGLHLGHFKALEIIIGD